MLILLLIIIFFTCFGLVWLEGLWNAALVLLNSLFAALIATSYFAPLAQVIESQLLPDFAYFWDFLSFWLLFAIVCSLLRLVTGKLSSYRVRFVMPIEMAGRSILALSVGWLMVCLTCFSLHMAPLSESPFAAGFQATPQSKDFLGMAPDQQWLALVYGCSTGSLSTLSGFEFDTPSEFIANYRVRRRNLEEVQATTGSFYAK